MKFTFGFNVIKTFHVTFCKVHFRYGTNAYINALILNVINFVSLKISKLKKIGLILFVFKCTMQIKVFGLWILWDKIIEILDVPRIGQRFECQCLVP